MAATMSLPLLRNSNAVAAGRRQVGEASSTTSAPSDQLQLPSGRKNHELVIVVSAVLVGTIALLIATVTARIMRNGRQNRERASCLKQGSLLARVWPFRRHQYKPTENEGDDSHTRLAHRNLESRETSQSTNALTLVRGDSYIDSNQIQTRIVDRNTSVRSVMTLPVYRPAHNAETEQVLGREGERDGIDVIVELRNAEEDEQLRDEEMEALYQIRQARRRQMTEREACHIERREARQRHDQAALDAIRDRMRRVGEDSDAEMAALRMEHDRVKQTRQRAASSVSYHDVGISRADGTRLRASSTYDGEAGGGDLCTSWERVGLLSDATGIAQLSVHGANQPASSLFDRRDFSIGSVLSIDTGHSHEDYHRFFSPAPTTAQQSMPRAGTARARLNPEIVDSEDGDLGKSAMAPPPDFEDVSLDGFDPVMRRSLAVSQASSPPPDAEERLTAIATTTTTRKHNPPPGYDEHVAHHPGKVKNMRQTLSTDEDRNNRSQHELTDAARPLNTEDVPVWKTGTR